MYDQQLYLQPNPELWEQWHASDQAASLIKHRYTCCKQQKKNKYTVDYHYGDTWYSDLSYDEIVDTWCIHYRKLIISNFYSNSKKSVVCFHLTSWRMWYRFLVASDRSIFPAYMVWLIRNMYQQFCHMISL